MQNVFREIFLVKRTSTTACAFGTGVCKVETREAQTLDIINRSTF